MKYEHLPKMYNSRKMACQKNGGEHYVMSQTCDKEAKGWKNMTISFFLLLSDFLFFWKDVVKTIYQNIQI